MGLSVLSHPISHLTQVWRAITFTCVVFFHFFIIRSSVFLPKVAKRLQDTHQIDMFMYFLLKNDPRAYRETDKSTCHLTHYASFAREWLLYVWCLITLFINIFTPFHFIKWLESF